MKKQIYIGGSFLGLALIIGIYFIKSKPVAQKEEILEQKPLVKAVPIRKVSKVVELDVQGKVEPAKTIHIRSEVLGKVIYQNPEFKKGGKVKKGEILLKIDDEEYWLAIFQKKSALERARLELALEEARSSVASLEFERRENKEQFDENAKKLILREPFLAKAKAEYEASVSDKERAELLLSKTIIRSPIDAFVNQSNFNEGEMVFNQAELGTLFDMSEFLVEVSIPLSDVPYLEFESKNNEGSKVVFSQKNVGNVKRLLPKLGSFGHMALILISIKNPIEQSEFFLPGALVTAKILGKTFHNAYEIPREALLENDEIFLLEDSETLKKVRPRIIRREKLYVYAEGENLKESLVVVSKNILFEDGSKVRLAKAQD